MPVFNEPSRTAEHLLWDIPEYSREQGTFASGNVFVPGQLIKIVSNQYVPAVPADTTGLFVCYEHVDATAAAQRGVVSHRLSVVNRNMLVYPAGSSGPQRAAHDAALVAAGIIVRS